jgi:hypothetical protein
LEVNGNFADAMAIYQDVAERHKGTPTGEEAEQCIQVLQTKIGTVSAATEDRDSSLRSE